MSNQKGKGTGKNKRPERRKDSHLEKKRERSLEKRLETSLQEEDLDDLEDLRESLEEEASEESAELNDNDYLEDDVESEKDENFEFEEDENLENDENFEFDEDEEDEEDKDASEDGRNFKKSHKAKEPKYKDIDETFEMSKAQKEKMAKKAKKKTVHRGRRKKNKNGGKIAAIIIGVIVAVCVVIYIGMGLFFQNHFVFNTTVNGVDYSLESPSKVEKIMRQKVDNYSLTLVGSDGSTEAISGDEIGVAYKSGGEVEELIKQQDGWAWISSLFEKNEIVTSVGVTYDETALAQKIDGLNCVSDEGKVASENAKPVFNNGKFEVQAEVQGTQVNKEKLTEVVKSAVDGFQSEINLKDTGCYQAPAYTSTSPEVQAACDSMNSYLNASVTYDFSPNTEVVDVDDIAQWLTVDDSMNVTFNEASVGDYVANLAAKYDTVGSTRTFTSAGSGKTITISGGAFGWQIDQEAETALLIENIKNGETVTREPEYTSKGKTRDGDNDIGDTYAEVDLTNQVMYYVSGGSVVMSTNIVSGNPNTGHATPTGVHRILYKESPSTLKGTQDENGNYEYETEVTFWMPFTNDGCGFHDATWQPTFGGSWYLTNGSHGCINMSYSDAEKLYSLIQTRDPVIVHE